MPVTFGTKQNHAGSNFEAGTLVVWDVDPIAGTMTSYRSDATTTPIVFKVGETATAEPALPGWMANVAEALV